MSTFGDKRLPDRFWSKVAVNEETGCWEWKASRDWGGYGQFTFRTLTKTNLAHRIAYLALVGEITKPQLDHLCRVRHCVNPDHLEPVTHAVNQQRGVGTKAAKSLKWLTSGGCHHLRSSSSVTYTTKAGIVGCVACLSEREYERYAYRWS